MSAWGWIAAAEAVGATAAAAQAIVRGNVWRGSSQRWRREALRLGNLLAEEREANLLSTHFSRHSYADRERENAAPG